MANNDRDVTIAFVGEDLVKPASDSAGRDIDRLQKKADAFNLKKAAKEQQDFSRLFQSSTKDNETSLQAVSRAIDEQKAKVAALRTSFAGSGSHAIFGDLKSAEGDLKALEGVLTDMGGKVAQDGAKAGSSFFDAFAGGLTSPAGLLVIAGLAPVIAVTAGGAIAAGLTTAVGFGFLAAGAYVLKGNKQLAADFGQLKSDIGTEVTEAASPLITPFEQALAKIDALFVSDKPDISAIFADVAPAVDELEGIFSDFVDAIVPELAPIGKEFSNILGSNLISSQIGDLSGTVGQFFHLIGSNQQTIEDTFSVLIAVVKISVLTLNGLLHVAKLVDDVWHDTPFGEVIDLLHAKTTEMEVGIRSTTTATSAQASALLEATRVLDQQGKVIDTTTLSWSQLATSIDTAAETESTFAGAVADKIFSTLMTSDEATLHWYESLTSLSTALKTNKKSLDIHSAAGQADREAILGVVSANIQQYDAMIASGISATDAAKAYDQNFQSLLHVKGLTKDQQKAVDDMVASYKKVPDKINTDIVLGDLDKTLQNLETLLEKIFHINSTAIDIHINDSKIAKVQGELARLGGGNNAAMEAAMNWAPAPVETSSGITRPARSAESPMNMSATVTSNFILDGQVIDRRVHRARLQESHRRKVGRR